MKSPARVKYFFACLDHFPGGRRFYNGRQGDFFSGTVLDRRYLTAAEAAVVHFSFPNVVIVPVEG